MILTQRNDRLYDSRNFDNYQNYYAIRYDVEKYHFIKDIVSLKLHFFMQLCRI